MNAAADRFTGRQCLLFTACVNNSTNSSRESEILPAPFVAGPEKLLAAGRSPVGQVIRVSCR
jgi:hypothetical protein